MAPVTPEWCLRGHREPLSPPPLQALTGVWGELKEPFVRGLPPLGEHWRTVATGEGFQTSKKSTFIPVLTVVWEKTEVVRVYSIICKHLFGKKGFMVVVWADKGFEDRAVQLPHAELHGEPISHLLPFQTEQAGEWQDYIFLEWPNGFSSISC